LLLSEAVSTEQGGADLLEDGVGISVIILCKNDASVFSCLRSVFDSEPKNKEVIVVDASDNKIANKLQHIPTIRYVRDSGQSIGMARDVGVESSRREIVCFLDSDVIVDRRHFAVILETYEKVQSADVLNISCQNKAAMFNLVQLLEGRARDGVPVRRRGSQEYRNYFAPGYCLTLKKRVWERCKFGNTPYGADDWEFSMKAVQNGFQIYPIRTESVHLPRSSLSQAFKEIFGWGTGLSWFLKNRLIDERVLKSMTGLARTKIYRLVKNAFLLVSVDLLMAPVLALWHVFGYRDLRMFPYFVFRQYSLLLGLLSGNSKRQQ